jgi:Raf kinase inhibitor-like YbhB/YbcL family protein
MRVFHPILWTLIALFALGCKGKQAPVPIPPKGASPPMAMTISSAAFREGESIPQQFTCDGEDASPPLSWSGVPQAARSLAVICDDPDAPAGTWVHWVLWNLPPSTPSLPGGVPNEGTLPGGIQQGKNSWPLTGYNGPCPPPGKAHRYFFKLYALDSEMTLPDGSGKAALEKAMQDHILAQAQLMGTYGRK